MLPAAATSAEYAKRIEESYPFHPRLIDTAKDKLGPLPEFQRSRGVLRLFARIIREIWNNQRDVELVTAGDINWASPDVRGDLLQRLRKVQFESAVNADLDGHALGLDDDKPDGIHYRVASALLLESLPCNEHSGLDAADLTLAILRTEEAGQEPAEALDRLVGACWHTYPLAGNRGWQFRFEPNVIKQIEQRAARSGSGRGARPPVRRGAELLRWPALFSSQLAGETRRRPEAPVAPTCSLRHERSRRACVPFRGRFRSHGARAAGPPQFHRSRCPQPRWI